jgi:ribonucleoside-diphosphate reductase alpha chain
MTAFPADISRRIWNSKYRLGSGEVCEASIEESWRRVAHALAAVERSDRALWEERFHGLLQGFRFLPGGRILAGAGSARTVTLFNCFVMGPIEDSVPGIFRALQESAVTMQQGGGIGCDFSTLRPAGTPARGSGQIASGPVSFMAIWDAMCATILSTGSRRGAMMATLRCDHPDIEAFVEAKRDGAALRRFNLSVLVSDAFMAAVRADEDWPLVFPARALDGEGEVVERGWSGGTGPVPCRVLRTVSARALWGLIQRAAYDCAEPGVLFVDRINALNNLGYCERISATNPCGEVPLPPYGACDLGSLNLTCFVRSPFTREARLDLDALGETAAVAVRLLDDVIDASGFPLPAQQQAALRSRRIGLGITGLADALVMLGAVYGDERSLRLAAEAMRTIRDAAFRASVGLAREKGAFPAFDRDRYLQTPFIRALPDDIRDAIAASGVRNSHLIAIAPTGTISLLAGNVSSGLEPVFAAEQSRLIAGEPAPVGLVDRAAALWRERHPGGAPLPPAYVTAGDLPVLAHLKMQAALQPYVDNSISKTINAPQDCPFEAFASIYDLAYDMGLKGCTAFRPNPSTGAAPISDATGPEGAHCCAIDREAD